MFLYGQTQSPRPSQCPPFGRALRLGLGSGITSGLGLCICPHRNISQLVRRCGCYRMVSNITRSSNLGFSLLRIRPNQNLGCASTTTATIINTSKLMHLKVIVDFNQMLIYLSSYLNPPRPKVFGIHTW